MKVQVNKEIRGEVTIPCMKKSFSGGTKIEMTEEQFLDSHTQWAIRNKMLVVLNGPKTVKQNGREFRSLMSHTLSIPCIKRAVNPGEVFFVKEENIDDTDLSTALAFGYVIAEEDYKKVRDQVKTNKKEMQLEKSKKTAKTSSKNTSKKKSTKKATKTRTNKTAIKTKIITAAEAAEKDADIPEGMYAHVPEGSDALPPTRVPKGNEVIIDLDLDLDGPEDTVSFVDQEQKTEAEARLNNIANDNEEVI